MVRFGSPVQYSMEEVTSVSKSFLSAIYTKTGRRHLARLRSRRSRRVIGDAIGGIRSSAVNIASNLVMYQLSLSPSRRHKLQNEGPALLEEALRESMQRRFRSTTQRLLNRKRDVPHFRTIGCRLRTAADSVPVHRGLADHSTSVVSLSF